MVAYISLSFCLSLIHLNTIFMCPLICLSILSNQLPENDQDMNQPKPFGKFAEDKHIACKKLLEMEYAANSKGTS
jgi:hypothetical protein